MKCLSIQIQPDIDPSHSPEEFVDLSRSLGRYPEIEKGDDNGVYVNLNYFTEELSTLWHELKTGILEDPAIGEWARRVTIVVAEGSEGWDNYLLLHHFDPDEKLDEV